MFFIRWDFTTEERKELLEAIIPPVLRGSMEKLAMVSEAIYDDIALWFREQVVEFGQQYLNSAAGKDWVEKWNYQRYVFNNLILLTIISGRI